MHSQKLPSLIFYMILFLFVNEPANAAIFTVTNTNDNGVGSLRQAIIDANNATTTDDTVIFQAGINGALQTSGGFIITDNLDIQGPGESLVINGNNAQRIFTINSGVTATLSGLQLQNGGIDNHGTLTLSNSTIQSSAWNEGNGGAIYNTGTGTLNVDNSVLSSNSAAWGGGIANDGILTITHSTLANNSAINDGGGVVNTKGTLTVSDSTLSGNSAGAWGGGVSSWSENLNANLTTIINSTLSGNSAANDGGGITNTNGSLVISNSTLSGNSAGVYGGGISSYSEDFNANLIFTISNSTLSGNSAMKGGGGISNNTTTLAISNSTLSGNSATTQGGGGINNYRATLTVTNSTLSGNSAADNGGGIANGEAPLTITNSTLSGNSAVNSGGGIVNFSGSLTLGNNLIAGNTANIGKEVYRNDGPFTSLGHNLFGENGSPGLANANPINSDLILPGPASTAIGPLADNGGPTQTHLPVAGSPAIDAGDNLLVSEALITDQRGYGPRIVNSIVDIGAVEVGATDPATTLITHYYESILRRSPEPDGLAFWQALIAEKQAQGEDVKPVFRQMANFFFFSDEYLARNTTDGEFITNLYFTFFQREPDQGGMDFWLNRLANGYGRDQAMGDFLFVPEFASFMQALGF